MLCCTSLRCAGKRMGCFRANCTNSFHFYERIFTYNNYIGGKHVVFYLCQSDLYFKIHISSQVCCAITPSIPTSVSYNIQPEGPVPLWTVFSQDRKAGAEPNHAAAFESHSHSRVQWGREGYSFHSRRVNPMAMGRNV